jgi:hypothetical protein
MQLKTRLVRLPDDRLALALTGGCRRGRCKCGYVYEPNLETGMDLPLASSSTRSPDSHRASKLASKMRCACSLSWGRVPADRDRHARFCQCQLSDGLCTLSEGAAGAPAGRSSVSRCQAADVDSEKPLLDLVDHIYAGHLVQCLDVLDELMRDPVAAAALRLGLVLLYF